MADVEKVTVMVLKVDLECSSCYKKVKKVLCEFPREIRDQVYDEKNNTVRITVVCCSPEKFRDKLCCKGGKTIISIEIVVPPPPPPPPPPLPPPPPPPPPCPCPCQNQKPAPIPVPVPYPLPYPVPVKFWCSQCFYLFSGCPGCHGCRRPVAPPPCYHDPSYYK